MQRARSVLAAIVLGITLPSALAAQRARNAPPAGQAVAQAGSRTDGKKAMTVADYARWRTIRDVAISDDGTWASFGYQQREVDDTLVLANLASGARQVIPRASRVQFSDDSRWAAYFVAAPRGRGRGQADSAAGGGRGNGGAQARNGRMELRSLQSGAVLTWDNVSSFSFSKGSQALMIRKARAGGGAPAVGTDLILHHLADGVDELIGSVSDAEFNHGGTLLAYTVAAPDREGNGLFLESIGAWQRRPVDVARADYARLAWDDSGTAVAALRGTQRRGFTERENTLVAITGLDGDEPQTFVLDPKSLTGLADTLVMSEKGGIEWGDDGSRVFVGLKAQAARPQPRRDSSASAVPVGNVDVWHWKDPYIQPVQMVRAQQERNRTYVATVLLAQKRVVPLADPRMDRVQIASGGAWAIGQDDKQYIDDWRPQRSDIYRLNTTTGERTSVLVGQERTLGLSPDGHFFLYWRDGQIWSYDIAANRHVNITKSAPVRFVNAEDDHVGEKPPYGIAGYSRDGKFVILDHRYDLWQVSLDGSAPARNLTAGSDAPDDTRFRYVPLTTEGAGGGFGGGRRGGRGGSGTVIDLSAPILLSAFGEHSKKAGFYRLENGQLSRLVYEDRSFGRPIKARNADRMLITRETFVDFPDYWVTDTRLSNFARLTTANPQQSEYLWGHRILIDYKDKDGHKLQGTLAIPDDYRPGERRPMLVYFYEKLSDRQNQYEAPRYASAPAYMDYVSNGYLVLLPDVYFHTGRSHTDMLNSVEAAVKRAVELGYADPKHVGLHGGSYSGQGGAYIATTSKMFAAIAIRAAAVDLIADFNQLWKTTGTNQHRYDTYGQGRFGTNPYDDLELFMDQSAVFHAKDMNTPLLIFQGTNDGSTEWLQGVEFYNALRFLKKPVVFLSYEGEGHGFTRYDNQYDVQVRMKQFYDHYLKGKPAPEWLDHGVPFIKKKTPTGAAAQAVQLIGPGGGIGTPRPGGAAGGGSGGGGGGGGGTPPE